MAAILGMLTGIGGGMTRDVLAGNVPFVLRADLYALAALAGGAIVSIGAVMGVRPTYSMLLGAAACISLRLMAIYFNWHAPLALEQRKGNMSDTAPSSKGSAKFQGNDKLLCGIILGVITFWLFAQTTLNIAPDMGKDLGLEASKMNIAVAITALFSGIFIVVMGGIADRVGRVKIVKIGFYLSILGSLLVGVAPAGTLASVFLLTGRALQGLSGACIMPASLALLKTYWDGAAPACDQPLVDWFLGWLRPLLVIRWGCHAEPRLALYFFCFCLDCGHRPCPDTRHT